MQRRGCLSKSDQYAFPLIEIVSRFVNLYSAFKKGYYSSTETILEELLTLEAELETWEAGLLNNWKFSLEPSPEGLGESIFKGQCHVYRDLW